MGEKKMITKLLYPRFRAVSERDCKEQIAKSLQRTNRLQKTKSKETAKRLEKWRTYQTTIVREF